MGIEAARPQDSIEFWLDPDPGIKFGEVLWIGFEGRDGLQRKAVLQQAAEGVAVVGAPIYDPKRTVEGSYIGRQVVIKGMGRLRESMIIPRGALGDDSVEQGLALRLEEPPGGADVVLKPQEVPRRCEPVAVSESGAESVQNLDGSEQTTASTRCELVVEISHRSPRIVDAEQDGP
jgi:hypothetical protein